MERLRILKCDYRKLTKQDAEKSRELQASLATKDSWLYHVTKLEAEVNKKLIEVKRLKEK